MDIHITDNAGDVAAHLLRRAERLRGATDRAKDGLARAAEQILGQRLQAQAPRRSGELGRGLRGHITPRGGQLVVSFTSQAPYTPFVVEGTGRYHSPDAHSPWDVTGPLQVFQGGGQTVFAMTTHHEGQKPNPFPQRALEHAVALRAALHATGREILVSFR